MTDMNITAPATLMRLYRNRKGFTARILSALVTVLSLGAMAFYPVDPVPVGFSQCDIRRRCPAG